MEQLDDREPTRFLLPGKPEYAILGAWMKDGTRHKVMPIAIQTARRLCLATGFIAGIVGVALLCHDMGLGGALTLLAGSHVYRMANCFPQVGFEVFAICS